MVKRAVLPAVLAMLLSVTPTVAEAQDAEPGAERISQYQSSELGWDRHRFHVSGFGGRLTGGNTVGSASNLFFQVVFEQGADALAGGRIGWTVAPRFDVEIEYGRSSPGLDAVLSDLAGQGRTQFAFADLDVDHLMAVTNYSVVERTRRLAPYLTLGIGRVRVASEQEPTIDASRLGLIYGIGLRVRMIEHAFLRADLRGMRAGFGTPSGETSGVEGFLAGELRASYLLWSVGAELRF